MMIISGAMSVSEDENKVGKDSVVVRAVVDLMLECRFALAIYCFTQC